MKKRKSRRNIKVILDLFWAISIHTHEETRVYHTAKNQKYSDLKEAESIVTNLVKIPCNKKLIKEKY